MLFDGFLCLSFGYNLITLHSFYKPPEK